MWLPVTSPPVLTQHLALCLVCAECWEHVLNEWSKDGPCSREKGPTLMFFSVHWHQTEAKPGEEGPGNSAPDGAADDQVWTGCLLPILEVPFRCQDGRAPRTGRCRDTRLLLPTSVASPLWHPALIRTHSAVGSRPCLEWGRPCCSTEWGPSKSDQQQPSWDSCPYLRVLLNVLETKHFFNLWNQTAVWC